MALAVGRADFPELVVIARILDSSTLPSLLSTFLIYG